MADAHADVQCLDFHASTLTQEKTGGKMFVASNFVLTGTRKNRRYEHMGAKFCDRFEFERALWRKNITRVAGVDEAGRGPLAGPVVAAAAILPSRWAESGLPHELDGLNDSKQLTEAQREKFFAFLTSCGEIPFAIAHIDAAQIDEINILQATHRAMNEALAKLNPQPQHALVDGRPVTTMRVPQTAIVKGDARSYSIAAASVLAKVTRDRLMLEFDRQFPNYGFAGHKGYGTAKHLAAIAAHGACPIHRKSFAPLKAKELELP
jgi:ribonuclease HII